MMNKEILNKYNVAAPRYTSYPPANFFDGSFDSATYEKAVRESNAHQPSNLSFYIHFPFCPQLCYYCACNAYLMGNEELVSDYIEALKKEMRIVFGMLSHERKISQIHYGGGTPTSMPVETIGELNAMMVSEFGCIDRPEIAIECHPGYMDESYWKTLPEIGFNRVSLGIQDFNEEVLKVSHRKAPLLKIEDIVSWLKARHLSVNFDFIYGLPLQTAESFGRSIDRAIDIHPDRIVTFSYGHVPWIKPLQKKLDEIGLPSAREKEDLFETSSRLLTVAGYKALGMDHFVLPDDELYLAAQNKMLRRNFQGYCTTRTTGQVYAFGVTGISQLTSSYAQNTKNIREYITKVNAGELPVLKGYLLSRRERIIREVIESLMCNYHVDWKEIASSLGMDPEGVKDCIVYDETKLRELSEDGIISYDDRHINVLPEAKPFVRNVAASLDPLMLHTDKKFSRAV